MGISLCQLGACSHSTKSLECTGFRHQNVRDLGATALLSPGMWAGIREHVLCYVCTPQTSAEMIHGASNAEPGNFPEPSMGLSFEISHHRILQMIKIYSSPRKERK